MDDERWLKFNARNWDNVQDGKKTWWRREPYNHSVRGKVQRVNPKWHILEEVGTEGEWNAVYRARCGYKHTFSRILLDRPRAVTRQPLLALLCKDCQL